MGPKASAPFQGRFVQQQVEALQAAGLKPGYHYMRWHSDSRLNRYLKYPVFLLDFTWRYLFTRQSFDIIHVHFFYPTIWLALLYKLCRHRHVRIIVTCHGSDIYKYKPAGWWYRWCAGFVEHWIFSSQSLAQHFFCQPASWQVLSAGIAQVYAAARQKPLADKDIDLLFVGSLDHNKGVDRLISLLPLLADKRILIIGSGPMQAQLQQVLALYPNASFLSGQTPTELQQWYHRARCLVSLSRNEAFGLVMAEAMACYTPVIATTTDGSLAQVIDGENGFLLPAHADEHALQQALLQALQQMWQASPEQYATWQQAARQRAEPEGIAQVAQRLELLYQQLTKQ